MFKSFCLLVVAVCALSSHARVLTNEQKLADFHYLVSVINAGYGPLEYKVANKIVALDSLNARFEQEIANTKTNTEFYYKMVEYVASYRDGHFSIRLPNVRSASLPILTDLVDGKVLITKINREKIKEDQFPFGVGDEIISVDGQDIQTFLDESARYVGTGQVLSQRRFAAWTVLSRNARQMPLPVKSKVALQIRRGTTALIEPVELSWEFKGVDLEEALIPPFRPFALRGGAIPLNYDLLSNLSIRDYAPVQADSSFICSGETRIAIPKDATIIIKKPFVAYYHPTAKGNVGYLRIPHYYPQPEKGENETEVALAWLQKYEFAIRELEKNTVGLIIDQDHNCGGSVWIVNKTIAMFMDRPFEPSQFELLASKESFLSFKKWADQVPEFTVERDNIDRVVKTIEEAWVKGTSFLTPKITISGEKTFDPNVIRYTKPVVILIDETSGSGGDMFPAMMKGLGRAKLFGQTTSGLGGHVSAYGAPLPNSQLNFRMTKSLFYRPDGVAIENNGAVPDKFYSINRDDVMYQFKGYQSEYLNYLMSLIP